MSWFRSSGKGPERPAAADPREERAKARRAQEARLRLILEKCCEYTVPSLLISPDEMTVHEAAFHRVTEEHLLVRVYSLTEDHPFRPLRVVFVSYAAHPKAGLFITQTLSCSPEADYHLLKLELPSAIATADTRKSYRVPVAPDAPLVTEVVTDDGARLPARCRNVSLAGALVYVKSEHEALLPLGTTCTVGLALPETEVFHRAEVRRITADGVGLFFPDLLVDGEVTPTEEHLALFRELERHWVQYKRCRAS